MHLIGLQAMLLQLARDKELPSDGDLFLLDVTGELDHLQSILERWRHRIEDIGRGDKQHLGQVIRDLDVMIGKRVVLLRIEHLQQCCRGVAPIVKA